MKTVLEFMAEIEATRARNNTNWMNLVRLAYELAPDRAAAIFQDIAKADEECLLLSKEIAVAHNKVVAIRTKIL